MEVRLSKAAERSLLRSNKRKLIRAKIAELAADPFAPNANVTRLQGQPEFRLRVQDWRVIFRVEGSVLWIEEIGPRGSIYRSQPR
ncbi:MAG TPA: type II toxin-antitoxin system RelE/ParE family toxin [Croceibacterium sp.]